MENQKLTLLERELGVGTPLVIGELYFKDSGRQSFHNGSDLPEPQSIVRQVGSEGDDIEHLDIKRHGHSFGDRSQHVTAG